MVLDAACSAHCELAGQAPALDWLDLLHTVPAVSILRVAMPSFAPFPRTLGPPISSGGHTSLTLLFLHLRN